MLSTSLLAWSGDSVALQLENRIAQLDDLRVSLVAQEAQAKARSAEKSLPEPENVDALDPPSVARAAYIHARALEISVGRRLERQLGLGAQSSEHEAEFGLREQEARRKILATAAHRVNGDPTKLGRDHPDLPPSGRRLEVHGALPTAASNEDFISAELAERLSSMDSNARAMTPMGESFARSSIARAEADPRFRARLVTSARALGQSFQTVARPAQLRAVFLAAAFSGSADVSAAHDVVAEPVAQWASSTLTEGVRARVYETYSSEYLAIMLRDGDAAAAMRAVETSMQSPLLDREVEVARSRLGALTRWDAELGEVIERRFTPGLVETHDGIVKEKMRDEAIRGIYQNVAAERKIELSPERLRTLLADAPVRENFETYFPSEEPVAPSAGEHTPPGIAPTSVPHEGPSGGGGGGFGGFGGGGGGASGRGVRAPSVASVRARSFVSLRGFSRVGGVLIGQDPKPGLALDIRGFAWKLDGQYVSLSLTDAKGHETVFGPFRAGIVNLALSYASDGRALTATMTKAEPLEELRILLHPALVDTGVGCRAIEIDRFVDEASTDASSLGVARAFGTVLVELQRSLYALARAELVKVAFPDKKNVVEELVSLDKQPLRLLDEITSSEDRGADTKIFRAAALAIGRPQMIFDPKVSPLTVRDWVLPSDRRRSAKELCEARRRHRAATRLSSRSGRSTRVFTRQ